jgi:hypothetical protein
MAHTYESWGYLKKDGALYGALSSFGIMTWMELGDSFSEYGFSHEDFIMNALGSLAGYFLHTNPALADIIDFRFEYRPRFDELDIFTDYEHSKFLKLFPWTGCPLLPGISRSPIPMREWISNKNRPVLERTVRIG